MTQQRSTSLCLLCLKGTLSADLFVQNVSVLHIVTDEMSRAHYLSLDVDPVKRKHEGVELLHRDGKHSLKLEMCKYLHVGFLKHVPVCHLGKVGFSHVIGQESDPIQALLIS